VGGHRRKAREDFQSILLRVVQESATHENLSGSKSVVAEVFSRNDMPRSRSLHATPPFSRETVNFFDSM
jgi:hypothetical protein